MCDKVVQGRKKQEMSFFAVGCDVGHFIAHLSCFYLSTLFRVTANSINKLVPVSKLQADAAHRVSVTFPE